MIGDGCDLPRKGDGTAPSSPRLGEEGLAAPGACVHTPVQVRGLVFGSFHVVSCFKRLFHLSL